MTRPSPWTALLPTLVLAACARPGAASPPVPAFQPADTGQVTVNGRASVNVPSDRASVRFAVETEASSAAAAVTANAERMDAAVRALRGVLGDRGTLETSGYSLSPVYSRPPSNSGGESRIASYRALNHVQVTAHDVEMVGALLDAAVGAGVNRVAGISFFASDTREARLEALRMATERAREEAAVLADALGVPLGPPLQVHSSTDQPGPRQDMVLMRAEAAVATPIEAGEQSVTANVSITYRLGAGTR